MSLRRVVVITGCDSGLGRAMALVSARAGDVTVAGLLQGPNSDAAEELKDANVHCVRLDVTSGSSISDLKNYVTELLTNNSDYSMHAVVNNAGVMTFGEHEWLTDALIDSHVAVNYLGPLHVTKAFLPILRRASVNGNSPRIINVGSHCGIKPLPNLSVYSSTKAALMAWTSALRIELEPYGVHAVTFVPGSFVMSSNLMVNQLKNAETMRANFDEEQEATFGDYFTRLNNHLGFASNKPCQTGITDEVMMNMFMRALHDGQPKLEYIHEPWRYTLYHYLFKLPFSEKLHSRIVRLFLQLPTRN